MSQHIDEAAAFIAEQVGLRGHEAGIAKLLAACHWMHDMQIARREARANPPPRPPDRPPGLDDRDDPDAWTGEDWDRFLRRRPGRPRNEPLIVVCQMVGFWWEEAVREPWAPSFELSYERRVEGEMVAANRPAQLLVRVAQELGDYTVENCNGAVDRLKQDRKSPDAKARRRDWNRAYGKQRRAKGRPSPTE